MAMHCSATLRVIRAPSLLGTNRRRVTFCQSLSSQHELEVPQSTRDSQREDICVVLVEPQIPQNAGNVARTCAATSVPLQLVGPVGFQLDSSKLKRAGLDYWPFVCVKVHASWTQFLESYDSLPAPKRLVAFTKFASTHYAVEGTYQRGDMLVFGAETHGLPDEAPSQILERGGALVKIPMSETHVRSLNLATSVGVGLYEALRQLDPPGGEAVGEQVDQHMRL